MSNKEKVEEALRLLKEIEEDIRNMHSNSLFS